MANIKELIEKTFKSDDNQFEIKEKTLSNTDGSPGVRYSGSYKESNKTLRFIGMENKNFYIFSLFHLVRIDVRKINEVDVYKAVNRINKTRPALKLSIDKIDDGYVYFSTRVELIQNKEFDSLNDIKSLTDIILLGGVYFKEEIDKVK